MRTQANADRNAAKLKAAKLNAAKVRAAKRDVLLRAAFGDTLRKFRIDRGLTQVNLAKKAGLPSYVVGALERKGRAIDLREELKLCHALEIPMARFLEEVRQAELRAVETIEADSEPVEDAGTDLGTTPASMDFEQAYEVMSDKLKTILLYLEEQALASSKNRRQESLGVPRRIRRSSSM